MNTLKEETYEERRQRRQRQREKAYACNKKFHRAVTLSRYGLCPKDYERMLAKQDGRCAICKIDTPRGQKGDHFAVDHCHTTGRIRGLLCGNCNRALGLFGDDVKRLLKAAEYLAGDT